MTCLGSSSKAPSGSRLEQVKLKDLPLPDSQFPGVGSRCLYFSYAVIWSSSVPNFKVGSPGGRRFYVFAPSCVGVGWCSSPRGTQEKLAAMSALTTRLEVVALQCPVQILDPCLTGAGKINTKQKPHGSSRQ